MDILNDSSSDECREGIGGMENNFSRLLLNDRGLRVGEAGTEIDVRLPWYRSLPLSVVDVGYLGIDGAEVPKEAMRLRVNGKCFDLGELPDRTEEFWFVLDTAVLQVSWPTNADRPSHEVDLQLDLYPPYIPHLKWVTRAKRTLRTVPASDPGRPR